MALTDKLTAIADAIRAKSGKSDAMTLDEMPIEISALSAEEQLKASNYPAYIHPEVLDVANKVNSVKKDDSIVFVAMSDSHYFANQVLNFYETETNASAVQANQAAKALAYLLNADFFAHLGDVSCGANSTTPDMLKTQIEGFLSYFREAKSDLPMFICIGNHDSGIYYHDAQTDGNIHTMTGEYLYKNFTAHSESDDTVFGDTSYGGYCYRDFADKKLRVFLLNTSEKLVGAQIDNTTYGAQRVWFANALIDLNAKSDAAEWGFIILSHYPADYGTTMKLSNLLEAYVKGTSITITDPADSDYYKGDGTNQTVNFTGKNGAKFIAQFHGHIHNFLTSKLYSDTSGSPVQYDAWRICVPNGQFNRENTYGTFGGVPFDDDKAYTKTANTANGTSFVVNVINPTEEKIYSFCYGAGHDRVIGFGETVYYSITYNLTGVKMSDGAVYSIETGKMFSASVDFSSVADGYDITSVVITMGGTDITASAYADGVINIAEVTGNVIVTIAATKAPTTNLGEFAEERDSTNIYNGGLGYKNDYRLADSIDEGYERALSGYVVTGYIPYVVTAGVLPKTIEIQGATLSEDSYCKIRFFGNKTATARTPYISGSPSDLEMAFTEVFTVETIGNKHYRLTPKPDSSTGGMIGTYSVPGISYMRICLVGTGEDLIITLKDTVIEETEPTSYTISNNLSNVTNSNSATAVNNGASYSATLTANEGYEISSVVVTMGGSDITSTVYNNGKITITGVTGNIVITAVAYDVATSYTNQLPISTDTDGSVYNGVGYKADTYLSAGTAGTRSGVYTSGFIPCKAGDTLYFKNCTMPDNNSNCRFTYFNSSKTYVTNAHWTTSNDTETHIVITYGSDGNIATMTIPASSSYGKQTGFIRFCCSYLGADSIVTLNEPIE